MTKPDADSRRGADYRPDAVAGRAAGDAAESWKRGNRPLKVPTVDNPGNEYSGSVFDANGGDLVGVEHPE